MSYKEIYQRSIQDREGFWREQAKELTWYQFPQTILSKTDEDLYQWFEDGKLNMSYLCLDYHIEQGRGEQVAIILIVQQLGKFKNSHTMKSKLK